jgi:hypothetical protein
MPAGTVIGVLSTADPDVGQTFTYTLTVNIGTYLKIVGSQLQTNAVLDQAVTPAIDVQIQTQDNGAGLLTLRQMFTIIVDNIPRPPGVFDTVMSVAENSAVGAIAGAITNTNPGALLNFTANAALSDAAALTMFRVQSCSGTIFVNQVSTACLSMLNGTCQQGSSRML